MSRSKSARDKWIQIIGNQRRSGMSVAAFCQARSIPASSLFAWKRKLAGAGAFIEATVRGVSHEHGGGVAIELRCGRRVIVTGGFDRSLLVEVLDVLESRLHEGAGTGVTS